MKKIAIVTGGSSGIGKAAALMLCENGYTVYEFSRRGENYSSIFHITADVTNPASIAAAAAKIIEKGKDKISREAIEKMANDDKAFSKFLSECDDHY